MVHRCTNFFQQKLQFYPLANNRKACYTAQITIIFVCRHKQGQTYMTEHKYMTVPEVASELRLTEQTVRDLIKRGDIPALKIGKQYRIKRADFEKLEAGTQQETK